MSKKPSKEIMEFMAKHSIDSDEIWQVHGTAWVIKHKALERAAVRAGIKWDRPDVIERDTAGKVAVVCVYGSLGEHQEWSIGEAAPANNKNAYPYAMAEKRGKDRVILKLLNGQGDLLYSEAEADEFEQPRRNPHVTRPADIVAQADYDKHGEVIDNVPHAEPTQKLRVVDQRPIFDALQKEAHAFKDYKQFLSWMNSETTIDRVKNLKPDWQDIFRGLCKEHLMELRPNTLMAG